LRIKWKARETSIHTLSTARITNPTIIRTVSIVPIRMISIILTTPTHTTVTRQAQNIALPSTAPLIVPITTARVITAPLRYHILILVSPQPMLVLLQHQELM
jgi:hypothetical protein